MSTGDDSRTSRAERKRTYKEAATPMGIYAVKNLANGKVLLGVSLNVPAMLNRLRFELTQGMHRIAPALQEDWNRYGAEQFSFEALDLLPPQEEPRASPMEELKVLEALWLDRLKPYGDAGYHPPPK